MRVGVSNAKVKVIASFGTIVSNSGARVSFYRTRGSRMASGNFTTKPMMLYIHKSECRNRNARLSLSMSLSKTFISKR